MRVRLVWAVPVVTAGVVAVMVTLSWGTEDHEGVEALFGLAFLAYATVGALIVTKQPANPVGWLFAALGLLGSVTEALSAYAARAAEAAPDPSPAASVAAWISAWAGQPSFMALVPLLLLFPDGRFLSTRWRAVGLASLVVAVVWAVALAIRPGPLLGLTGLGNPVGLDAAGGVLDAVVAGSSIAFFLLVLAAVAAVIERYRVSEALARQQIKWLTTAGATAVAAIVGVGAVEPVLDTDQGAGDVLTALLVFSAVVAFPVAAALAILRHGLYDVDVVIKRTLVYSVLTAALVATYLGSVLLLQLVLGPLTAESDLAVAASTLAVAGLFRPLRSRIQLVVDRRFYRLRYDAQRTVDGFSARLRAELDLDALAADLRRVVVETVQPAHVSLWLREGGR
jgi:hypothetical protein